MFSITNQSLFDQYFSQWWDAVTFSLTTFVKTTLSVTIKNFFFLFQSGKCVLTNSDSCFFYNFSLPMSVAGFKPPFLRIKRDLCYKNTTDL